MCAEEDLRRGALWRDCPTTVATRCSALENWLSLLHDLYAPGLLQCAGCLRGRAPLAGSPFVGALHEAPGGIGGPLPQIPTAPVGADIIRPYANATPNPQFLIPNS